MTLWVWGAAACTVQTGVREGAHLHPKWQKGATLEPLPSAVGATCDEPRRRMRSILRRRSLSAQSPSSPHVRRASKHGSHPVQSAGVGIYPPHPRKENHGIQGSKPATVQLQMTLIAKVLLMRYAHTHKRDAHVCIHAASTYRNGSRKRSLALLHRSSPAMAAGFEVN